jgi:hypothetical protein
MLKTVWIHQIQCGLNCILCQSKQIPLTKAPIPDEIAKEPSAHVQKETKEA